MIRRFKFKPVEPRLQKLRNQSEYKNLDPLQQRVLECLIELSGSQCTVFFRRLANRLRMDIGELKQVIKSLHSTGFLPGPCSESKYDLEHVRHIPDKEASYPIRNHKSAGVIKVTKTNREKDLSKKQKFDKIYDISLEDIKNVHQLSNHPKTVCDPFRSLLFLIQDGAGATIVRNGKRRIVRT